MSEDLPIIEKMIATADTETRCRWWCEMNCFRWPAEWGATPYGWECSTDRQKHENDSYRHYWEALDEATGRYERMQYWNGAFDRGSRSIRQKGGVPMPTAGESPA